MNNTKKVLVCPLNWGIGHASRIIPVIYELVKNNYHIYIGADGFALQLLKQEFPQLTFIKFPSFTITYGKGNSIILPMILQIPGIILGIIKEHNVLKRLVAKYSPDLIISDNRFGLWSKKAYSVYITHQINIILPGWTCLFKPFVNMINRFIISKYNQCWIPDFEDNKLNLTGKLSHKGKLPQNAVFIGPLSRFNKYCKKIKLTGQYIYDLLLIVSGPEPQRTMLEDILTEKISKFNYRALIIQGRPGEKQIINNTGNITRVSHLSTSEFLNFICHSRYIICRSGYSNIMDLVCLRKTAILIPTPGQPEQEYLAGYLSNYFCSTEQDKIELAGLIKKMKGYNPEIFKSDYPELKNYIKDLNFKKPGKRMQ